MNQSQNHRLISSSVNQETRIGLSLIRVFLLNLLAAGIAVDYGFDHQSYPVVLKIISVVKLIVYSVFVFEIISDVKNKRYPIRDVPPTLLYKVLVFLGAIGFVASGIIRFTGGEAYSEEVGGGLMAFFIVMRGFEAAVIGLFFIELWQMNVILSRRFFRPGFLLPLSFLSLIVVGTPLLMLPLATEPGVSISWLDALFTMTSAVCVTGLSTVDTSQQFSVLGQGIIIIFIQLGGLGIVIFGSVMAMLLGQRFSLRENLSLSSMLNDQPLDKLSGFIRFVVMASLTIELFAAAAMLPMWPSGFTFVDRVGYSIFHAVSAFCNAGFSLQSDSFVGYQTSPIVHVVLLPLIVVGGIGFPVLDNLLIMVKTRWKKRKHLGHIELGRRQDLVKSRLTLHSKTVLATTAILYLVGVMGITVGQLAPKMVTRATEKSEAITMASVGQTLADASFMSVSSRTAGFKTIDMQELEPGSRLVMMALMMVGASPGSTGGGMKTTALALLVLGVVATLRRQNQAQLYHRNIADDLMKKGAALAACLIGLACITTFLLCLTESSPLDVLAFEAVSAASTTGLSVMEVPRTGMGKVVIIFTMFLGRIGPMALLGVLLFNKRVKGQVNYPHEPIIMG